MESTMRLVEFEIKTKRIEKAEGKKTYDPIILI
jgi:hypothetical protein